MIGHSEVQWLAVAARNVVGNAIKCGREGDVTALLSSINDEPDLPIPSPRLFMAARLIPTNFDSTGQDEVAELLEALEEDDERKFAGVGACLFRGSQLGRALAAVAFDPEDTGHEERTIALCQQVIRELAEKWNVEVSS